MAKFKVRGMDELIETFNKLTNPPDELMERMLDAMAETAKVAMHDVGMSKGVYDEESDTHILDKLKTNKPKLTETGGYETITFSGTRTDKKHNRTRNAEIAFVNEYGKEGQPARPFVRVALAQHEEKIVAAGQKVLNDYIDSL